MFINAPRFKAVWLWLVRHDLSGCPRQSFVLLWSYHSARIRPNLLSVSPVLFFRYSVFAQLSGAYLRREPSSGTHRLQARQKRGFAGFLSHAVTLCLQQVASHSQRHCQGQSVRDTWAGANPTIEARLDAIENNVTSIHERISQVQREMDGEFQKTTDALNREEQARQAEDNTIREKLEATGTGGVHISAIGASWLLVGVILSTAAIEIAALLK